MNSSIQGSRFHYGTFIHIFHYRTFILIFLIFLFIVICMGISLACTSVHHMCTVPMEARRASDPLGQQLTGMWVLRTNPGSFGREATALNHWLIQCSNPRTFILDSRFRYQLPTLCTVSMFLYEHMYHSSYKKTIGCPSETDHAHANYLVKTNL